MNDLKMLLTTRPFPIGTNPTTKTPIQTQSTQINQTIQVNQMNQINQVDQSQQVKRNMIEFEMKKCESISILYIHVYGNYYQLCLSKLTEYINSLSDDLKNSIVIASSM